MTNDEVHHELERLAAMGREAPEEPTDRHLLVAKLLSPSAWSASAEEHIAWCRSNNLIGSPSYFGAQHLAARKLALLRATEIIRRLERHDAGLPDLEAFDARSMSEDLRKEQFELYRAKHPRDHVYHEPAGQVFFLKTVDGIPKPASRMAPDGEVTLTWREDDREAHLHITRDKAVTMTIGTQGGEPIALDVHRWRDRRTPMLIAAVTDWIHFSGPDPRILLEIAGDTVEAA